MKKFLVVVDIQNDFVSGSLGTEEAKAIISGAAEYIRSFNGEIFVTLDTHFSDYLKTSEGEKLPVEHCIKDTEGWRLNEKIAKSLSDKNYTLVEKVTFGSVDLPDFIKEAAIDQEIEIELIGLCTDICVVSNALILKANFPESEISVIERLCAGVTPDKHKAAIETMRSCQINIL